MFFMIKSFQIQIFQNGFQFRIVRVSADLWNTISKTPNFISEIFQFRNSELFLMFLGTDGTNHCKNNLQLL